VAVGAGGWWVFVREDAQLATDPPEIPRDLLVADESPSPAADGSGGSGGADASGALTFQIIAEESEAAYFVGEELASLPLPSTAKGATGDVEGEFVLSIDGTALAPGTTLQFVVDLRNLTSDESRRDGRVQDALDTGEHPFATFTISEAAGYDPSIPEGEEQSLLLSGIMELHGAEREVTWEVKAIREGNVISALATTTIAFEDFDITPPNIAGFVSVDDKATLQVQIVAVEV
jgi:polyisoprenoid-binding protein YceI